MSDTVQTIFAVLGTVFDMFTTILFYKTCLGSKNIKVNKIVFFTIFIFSYILGLALSQFGYAPAFYVFKSFIIMFGLTLLYNSKWTTRLFTALSYLAFGMISELISYGIIIATVKNSDIQSMQNYSLMLSVIFNFIITLTVTLILKKKLRL